MPSEAVGTELAIREETSAVMLTNAQLQMIANTSFVPAAFRGKVPEVLACVATGRALGLPDMTSLRGINVIDGKATLSAELMVAIVRSHGHSITGTTSSEQAVVRGRRRDNGDEIEATFTMAMAKKIQMRVKGGGTKPLVDKDNWRNYPEAMLWARAVSQLCRMLFADCFAGATYVPEEMELTADEQLDERPVPSGLAEPGDRDQVAEGSPPSSSSASPVNETDDPGSDSPGSVSPIDQLIETFGRDRVKAAYREVFPDRPGVPLDADEAERLADHLLQAAA